LGCSHDLSCCPHLHHSRCGDLFHERTHLTACLFPTRTMQRWVKFQLNGHPSEYQTNKRKHSRGWFYLSPLASDSILEDVCGHHLSLHLHLVHHVSQYEARRDYKPNRRTIDRGSPR